MPCSNFHYVLRAEICILKEPSPQSMSTKQVVIYKTLYSIWSHIILWHCCLPFFNSNILLLTSKECSTGAEVVHWAVCSLDRLRSLLCCLFHSWDFCAFHFELSLLGNFGRAPTVRHLLVCGDVEQDEKDQVRTQNRIASDGSKRFSCACAHVRHIREVCAGEIIPRSEVHEAWFLY